MPLHTQDDSAVVRYSAALHPARAADETAVAVPIATVAAAGGPEEPDAARTYAEAAERDALRAVRRKLGVGRRLKQAGTRLTIPRAHCACCGPSSSVVHALASLSFPRLVFCLHALRPSAERLVVFARLFIMSLLIKGRSMSCRYRPEHFGRVRSTVEKPAHCHPGTSDSSMNIPVFAWGSRVRCHQAGIRAPTNNNQKRQRAHRDRTQMHIVSKEHPCAHALQKTRGL